MVLHSHIPYVKRQGKWPFGEVWLFEAMAETYIPLLINWLKLCDEGKETHITMSFSPVLLEQLNSKYIKQEFVKYLKEREAMSRADERYYLSQSDREFARIAAYYANFYRDIRRDYEMELDRDVIPVSYTHLFMNDSETVASKCFRHCVAYFQNITIGWFSRLAGSQNI